MLWLTLIASSTFAYTPRDNDEKLLENLESRVDMIVDKQDDRVGKMLVRLDFILTKVPEDSRAHYILGNLYDMVLEATSMTQSDIDTLALDMPQNLKAGMGKRWEYGEKRKKWEKESKEERGEKWEDRKSKSHKMREEAVEKRKAAKMNKDDHDDDEDDHDDDEDDHDDDEDDHDDDEDDHDDDEDDHDDDEDDHDDDEDDE